MDRRCTSIGWLGIVCLLLALATEAAWIEKKALFFSQNERIMDRMLRTMNESVSPCQDFHTYSFGRYGEGFDVKPKYLLITAVEEQINPKFHDLFERLKDRSFERGSMEEKVFRLYNSCEAARRENRTSDIFSDVMRPDVNLSWPSYMPEGRVWPKERFRWLVTLARLSRYGMRNVLFNMALRVDAENIKDYLYVIERPFDAPPISRKVSEKVDNLVTELFFLGRTTKSNKMYIRLEDLEKEYGISLMEFFKVALDKKFDRRTRIYADVGYLVELNQLLNSYDQDTVASYLMEDFVNFMASYKESEKYQCVVAVRTSMKAATELLYEEHVLGEKREQYDSELQRIFTAVRKQFSQRLEANRMNLSNSEISNLRHRLSTTTLNVGVLPKKKDRRSTDNYLYDKLDFDSDDDFATLQLKAMYVLPRSEDLFLDKVDKSFLPHPGFTIEFGDTRTIFIPYDLLVEPFFMTQSHEVFKVSFLGYIIAHTLLKALHPTFSSFDCRKYTEFIGLLDDKQLYWDRSTCFSRNQVDNFNWWGIHLVLVNMLHDAYFSPDSGFSQVQPDFTDMPLKQLFLLNIAQNILGSQYYWWPGISAPTVPAFFDTKSIYNPVFRLPIYAEVFNCSSDSYPAVNLNK